MNRRDFLHPRNLMRQAGQVAGAIEEVRALVEESPAEDAVLLRFSRRAMATSFEIILPMGTLDAQEVADYSLDVIDRVETRLTVYRDDSEVSYLNQRAFHEPVNVSTELFGLLTLAKQLAEETGGAFDITVGALIKAWGFYRRAGRVPARDELESVRGRCGMRHLRLDATERSARFGREGLEINLGSIGKGYALDVVAKQMRAAWNLPSALLHGGHSSVYALGSEPGSSRGWSVGVLDPENSAKRLAVLRLHDRGMGTSAATYQHLEFQGRKLPHLLDPRTAWPAEGMLMATVTAPSATVADALATAFFILGVDKARDYCTAHPEIGAVLLPADRKMVTLGRAREEMQ